MKSSDMATLHAIFSPHIFLCNFAAALSICFAVECQHDLGCFGARFGMLSAVIGIELFQSPGDADGDHIKAERIGDVERFP